jgi:putative PEP-CTERM system TPR-repeat lipoprotein
MISTRILCRSRVLPLVLAALFAACSGESPESMLSSAKNYLAKNDPKAAVIQIKNALQKNPDNAEARFLLGKALLDSGDPVAAELELRKAMSLKYSPEQAAPLLLRSLVAQGQAKKVVDEVAKLGPMSAEATAEVQTSLASALASLGQSDDASKALARALEAKPDHAPARLLQARVKALQGDLPGAIAIVDEIIAKTPSQSEAHKFRGDILVAKGDRPGAMASYRKAVEAKSDNVMAHAAIIEGAFADGKIDEAASQIEQLKKVAPKSLATAFLDARLSFQRKDYAKARDQVQQYLKRAPDHAPGLLLAGSIELAAKSYPQAEIYFSKLVRATPDSVAARRLLAMTHLSAGQPNRAAQVLEPVLLKIDRNPQMLSLVGAVAMANGDAAKAEQYFQKASVLDPKNSKNRAALALTHIAKGESSGYSELEDVAAADPGTQADMALIAAAMRRGQFDRALKAIDSLQKKEPNSAVPYHLRGGALLGKKDVVGARKSLEKGVEIQPGYFPAALALAGLDIADKKPEVAAKRFEAVLSADPKNMQAYLALADLKAHSGGTPREIEALLEKAVETNPGEIEPRAALFTFQLRTKDTKKALTVAQGAVVALPNRAEAHEMLGRVQLASGDTNQALASFAKAAGLQPNSPAPHLYSAEAHIAAKNREAAIQSLKKALDIRPNLLDAQRALIGLYVSNGIHREALDVAFKVQKQRPKEPVGYMFEGDVRGAMSSWKEAVAAYRAGLKISAAPELAVKLHAALLTSGNTAEGQQFAASWLRDHPKDALFRFHLADQALHKSDLKEAEALYRSVAELQPNNSMAFNNLAWISAQRKNPRALEYAEKANQLSPSVPTYMDTLAMILLENGDHTKAVDLLKRASALSPQLYPIRMNLVRALAKAGDKAGARKELDSLAQLGDKGPKKEDIDRLRKEL